MKSKMKELQPDEENILDSYYTKQMSLFEDTSGILNLGDTALQSSRD